MKALLIRWANCTVEPCARCEEKAAAMVEAGEALLFDGKADVYWIDNERLAHIYQVFSLDGLGRTEEWPLCCERGPFDCENPSHKPFATRLDAWHELAAVSEERCQALEEFLLMAALNGGRVP